MSAALPNILICGTPGCGKTSLCELTRERVGFAVINVGEIVRTRGLHAGRDAATDAFLIDEASEDRIVDELDARMRAGGNVLEHHSVDFFPERWFDLVLCLRTDNTVLFDRLVKRCLGGFVRAAQWRATGSKQHPPDLFPPTFPNRGYAPAKITENVEAEIMGVVAEEARESYRAEIVHELQSNTLEDLEGNADRVVAWVTQWKAERAAAR